MLKTMLFLAGSATVIGAVAQAGNALPMKLNEFHKWHKVNPKPHYISSLLDGLCRNVTPEEAKREREDPHVRKTVTVYVNAAGQKAMAKGTTFPVGSVIVKEKFADISPSQRRQPARTAELSTVMIKREAGFNPKCGDWEFLVLDGAGANVLERGKTERCMSCHANQARQDYVFRSYAP